MECIGTVRLTPEAEKVVHRLKAKTGLPIRQIVSDIIVQAEVIITIETEEDTYMKTPFLPSPSAGSSPTVGSPASFWSTARTAPCS